MAYLYRVEDSTGVGPFKSRHGLMNTSDEYKDKVMSHITKMELSGDVMNLLSETKLQHMDVRFGCRTIPDLCRYLGPLVIKFCKGHKFVLVRYEVPDDCIFDGEYQSIILIKQLIHKEYLSWEDI